MYGGENALPFPENSVDCHWIEVVELFEKCELQVKLPSRDPVSAWPGSA